MIPSRVQFAGHPIHPMLTAFPIAFLSGGLLFDVVYAATGDSLWYVVAAWMLVLGVIGAAVAAVPGLVDYLGAIPAAAPAKTVATFHLLSNTIATALFAVSMALHFIPAAAGMPGTVMALDMLGFAALFTGGWLGGELVYRHHIAIQPTAEAERNERARRAA